jgi:hypothetical protein
VKALGWYDGAIPTVPGVELDGVQVVACPFCPETHLHVPPDGECAPDCDARRRYNVRGLPPLAYVRLVLSQLGFNRREVQQIMMEAMRAYALRWCAPASPVADGFNARR